MLRLLLPTVALISLVTLARAGDAVVVAPGAQPRLAADGQDVYLVFGRKATVCLAVSKDGGKTFGEPREAITVPHMPLGMRRGPRVAVSGKAIVVTAITGAAGGGKDGDLYAWRSTDAGKT